MATRITIKHLTALAERINKRTKSPSERYINILTQVGHFRISRTHGGYCLHRMCNGNGATQDVFRCGHVPSRELAARMEGFIEGLEFQA